MLGENQSQTASEKDKTTTEKDPKNSPKISKKKAEGNHDDKPLH
jgi:hypothetical protein